MDLVANSFGFGPLPQRASITFYFFFTATIAVIKDSATVLGEEIGWRGFLVPNSPSVAASLSLLSFRGSFGPSGTIAFSCSVRITA